MRGTFINRKYAKLLAMAMVVMLLSYIGVQLTAADSVMTWRKQDTIDTNFTYVENKTGDDEVLLELDVEDTGTYSLTYNLEDGYQTYIEFVQGYDELTVEYHIYESDGAGGYSDVTQERVSESYLEMNYDLTVPDWEYDDEKSVGDSGGLEYSISKSASSQYPGISIEVDNKQLIVNWEFAEDLMYVLISDYQYGSIMPVTFSTPNKGSESMKVLKQLEDFEISPTHYVTTDGATNYELVPIVMPNDTTDSPGSRPGLDITFKQPMELNEDTWVYEYNTADMDDVSAFIELEDVADGSYLDFSMALQNETDMSIYNLNTDGDTNDDVVYLYDADTYTYTIHVVQDKSELALQDTFIEWDALAGSSIYDATISFEVDLDSSAFNDYEFTSYLPESDFAYTYLEYELVRSSTEEAYLDVTAYNAGDQEEISYTVLYSKTVKETLDIDEDLWLEAYHTTEDGDDEIFIPVPFRSTSAQDAYQIVVEFSGVEIYTQVLNYQAIEDDDVPPTTPVIELVDNLFVTPSIEADEEDYPERVKFDLVWTAPTNVDVTELDDVFADEDGIENDWIYYELSVNDLPTDDDSNPFEVIKIFRVREEDGEYIMELYRPEDGTASGSDTANFVSGYNENDEEFRMDDIVIREDDLWSHVYETSIDDDEDTYTIIDTGEEADIEFPGINYLRIKAITVTDGEISSSDMSVAISLSLSMQTYDLPRVDTLDYDPLYGSEEDGTAGATLIWDSVDVSSYESYMLSPIGKQIEDMWYSVYIAEDKDSILPLDDDDSDYMEIAMDNDGLVTVGSPDEDELDFLREGGVIYFNLDVDEDDNTTYEVDVEGLDINREYYVRIVTKISANDTVDEGNEDIEVRSEASDALGITIPQTPDEPSDDELTPLAPEAFEVTFADESLSNALLEWEMPTELSFDDDAYGFEVFSIVDRSMPDDFDSSELELIDIMEDSEFDEDVIEGWRIYVNDGEIHFKKYDFETDSFEDYDIDLLEITDYDFAMTDDDNSPNKVNYYYVRTLKLSGETMVTASTWVSGSLTTSPVQGPINLVVDYDTDYDYDPQEELIIRFDAPISDVDDIGSDYIMEVYVKGEDDDDYTMDVYPYELVGTDGDVVTGYERLYYRLEELTPGKEYSIKVRIEDRTQPVDYLPDGSTQYPRSAFTDIVTTRTEFDQESYDKENKYYEYIDYYLTQAEELAYIEYFTITDDSDETAVKYREDYATGLIHMNADGEFWLYSGDNEINTYYFPSGSIELINDDDVTLVIETLDHQVGIRPDAVGEGITDEIDDMLESIERYTSTDEDYYVRMRVYSADYNGSINSADSSSELVELELTVIGSELTEEEMDELMVDLLDTVIEANQSDVIAAIEEDLENGIDDDSLLEIVEEVLEDVKDEYVGQASILFKGYLSDMVTEIDELNEPIYVALMAEDTGGTHDVYTKEDGSWHFASSSYLNGRYYVDAADLQPYLTVEKGSSDLVETYGQEAVDVVNEFGLTTVFSDYDLSDPDELLDKYQWINAVSRLLGARAGEDTVDYLTDLDIDADGGDLYEAMNRDEGLYIYAQAFAEKHNLNLEAVHLSDYLAVKDMDEVDEDYQETLLQAANLDIIPMDQGYMSPDTSLDMAFALDLLTILYEGLK